MNKTEYISALQKNLKDMSVRDIEDIISEYEAHFDYKLRDGFSEEEIAAKLGDPKELAEQFGIPSDKRNPLKAAAILTGLAFMDVIAWPMFVAIFSFTVALASCAVAFFAGGLYWVFRMRFFFIQGYELLPHIPFYGVSLLLGLCMLALFALSACGTAYYTSYAKGLTRSFLRIHQNCIALANGRPALPALPVQTRMKPLTRRILRMAIIISLAVSVVLLIAGYIAATISAGSFEFWHIWGWFQ